MPHVVLEEINSIREAFDSVLPFTTKIDGGILKVTDTYINSGQNKALVESLAIKITTIKVFLSSCRRKKRV